jgi:hypothetical protein
MTITHDVFVSYRQREPDRTWVRGRLVPGLRRHGISVFTDYEHFRLGAALVKEMARGVEVSRYTLAVLSPRYLESNYTELESVLAEHLGIENNERRLLAVMREQCTPPLGYRARLSLEMIDDADFEVALEQLVTQLRLPNAK